MLLAHFDRLLIVVVVDAPASITLADTDPNLFDDGIASPYISVLKSL